MTSIIYTNQRSKKSKKAREAEQALRAQQRAVRSQLAKAATSTKLRESTWGRPSAAIPSAEMSFAPAAKKETPTYTGTLVIGIATMHKSNAVPIINQEQATDIARMRR